MLDVIWEALKKIWHTIKKIILKILNFIINIVNWFKERSKIKLQDPNIIATTIRQKLENGDYIIVNALYNTETNTIKDAVVYQCEELDEQTKMAFGGKDMIILR